MKKLIALILGASLMLTGCGALTEKALDSGEKLSTNGKYFSASYYKDWGWDYEGTSSDSSIGNATYKWSDGANYIAIQELPLEGLSDSGEEGKEKMHDAFYEAFATEVVTSGSASTPIDVKVGKEGLAARKYTGSVSSNGFTFKETQYIAIKGDIIYQFLLVEHTDSEKKNFPAETDFMFDNIVFY